MSVLEAIEASQKERAMRIHGRGVGLLDALELCKMIMCQCNEFRCPRCQCIDIIQKELDELLGGR